MYDSKKVCTINPPQQKPISNIDTYVRQYCLKNNISMQKLADLAGMAKATLYDLLKPKKDARISQIISLAHAMGVHPQILLQLKWFDFDLSNITSTPTPASAFVNNTNKEKLDASAFVSEYPADGVLIAPNTQFTKSWTIQNVGRQIWENRFLACQNPFTKSDYPENHPLNDYCLRSTTDKIAIPTTYPGECVTLCVDFITPKVSGHYMSYWKMVDSDNNYCFKEGTGLSVLILVQSLGVSVAF